MKTKFVLPQTKLCVVIWYRNGQKNETIITTPANNDSLYQTMLMKHRVGFSEIRAIMSIDSEELVNGIINRSICRAA